MELLGVELPLLLEDIVEEDALSLETQTSGEFRSATLHCLDSVPANLGGTTQI